MLIDIFVSLILMLKIIKIKVWFIKKPKRFISIGFISPCFTYIDIGNLDIDILNDIYLYLLWETLQVIVTIMKHIKKNILLSLPVRLSIFFPYRCTNTNIKLSKGNIYKKTH